MPKIQDGFNPRIQHLIPQNPTPKKPKTVHKITPVPPPTPKPTALPTPIPSQPLNVAKNDDVLVKPAPNKDAVGTVSQNTTPKANIKFRLDGIRFGRWALMADLLLLDDEMMATWESLKQAITRHATTHAIPHHSHEAEYPMINTDNDYKEHRFLMPADGVFWGFLFGLGLEDNVSFGCLSALPDGVPDAFIHRPLVDLPTLEHLVKNTNLKKQLWEKITQNP